MISLAIHVTKGLTVGRDKGPIEGPMLFSLQVEN